MMFAIISRRSGAKETFGCFCVFDEDRLILNLKSLELPDLHNQKEISCIPVGEYDVIKITNKKYGVCFHVLNVPGRSEILIHIGNFATGQKVDTRGCILPGMRFEDRNNDGNLDVVDSTKAMNMLRVTLPDKFKLIIK